MGLVAPQHVGSSPGQGFNLCLLCIGRWLLYHWANREALANSSVCYLLFVKIANVIFLSWMDLEMMQPPSEDWILPVLFLPSEYSPTFVLCSFSASHEIQPSHSSICIHLFLPTCNPFFKICSGATKSFTAATKWICLLVPWDVRAVWAFMSLYSALSCCCLCIFFISLPLHIWILNLSGLKADHLLVLLISELWGAMQGKNGRWSWVMRWWASARKCGRQCYAGEQNLPPQNVSLWHEIWLRLIIFFSVLFFYFWLHALQDISSPTRDQTLAHGSEITES